MIAGFQNHAMVAKFRIRSSSLLELLSIVLVPRQRKFAAKYMGALYNRPSLVQQGSACNLAVGNSWISCDTLVRGEINIKFTGA